MRNTPYISVDGVIKLTDEVHISPFDRSLRMGDGLFETIRVSKGKVLHMGDHLNRLVASAFIFEYPLPDHGELVKWVLEYAQECRLKEGSLRITVTRGNGNGVWPPAELPALVLMTASEGIPYPDTLIEKGLKAVIIDEPRRCAGIMSRHKTTSYLPSVLARKLARESGGDIAIVLNQNGDVAEADAANIFIAMKDGRKLTPPIDDGALPGITRGRLLGKMSGIEERTISVQELKSADEIIFTNALMPVIAASSLDGTEKYSRSFFNACRAVLLNE